MAVEDSAVRVTYACNCLNIRITASTPPLDCPDYPPDPSYIPVFVTDDGIQVNHPQGTVRLLSRPFPISGTTRHSRFTALTCLFCAMNVYRVHHIISMDIEGNETTLFPSEDWVEREILKSGTGWIDVHKDCLPTGLVSDLLSSPAYAPLFSLLLPQISSSPPSPDVAHNAEDSPTTEEKQEEGSYLPRRKPIFLPPPFTPSNPVFTHLAEISNKRSQELRTAAEDRIRQFIEVETSGVIEKERVIRHQAESLWKVSRRHLAELQLESNRSSGRSARSPSRSRGGATTNGFRPPSSVAVKTFIPAAVSSSPWQASPPLRVSALAASLATSAFYHPKMESRCSLGEITSNPESVPSYSPSTRLGSSTLVIHTVQHAEGSNVLQFKRRVNEDINIQASYRYFVDLEEDMRRYKQARDTAKNSETVEPGPPRQPNASPNKERTRTHDAEPPFEMNGTQVGVAPSRGRDKGKRKVTFDVKPDVVRIVEDEKDAITSDQEAIFPLDDVVMEEVAETPDHDQSSLPLLEQPPPRPVTIKKRSQNATSDAFHCLRPASLPAPSHIRPIRSPPGVDSCSPSVLAHLPKAPPPTRTLPQTTIREPSSPPPSAPLTEPDMELLELVAADTPGHHGAWVQDSGNWKSLTSSRYAKGEVDETEEDTKSVPILDNRVQVGSLPIKIRRPEVPRPLSLASYVGQDGPVTPLDLTASNHNKPSSNAIRKAVSLEKDRARSMDPGPLDSVVEEDELDDETEITDAGPSGEKARRQTFHVLKTRSELPEEGMWRSLA